MVPKEISDKMDDKGFITNYIVLYETSTGNGRFMNIGVSDEMTPWLAEGMINFGRQVLSNGRQDVQ